MAGLEAEAQEPSAGSLYIPKPHLVEDRKFLQDFMDEFSFVDLVTASPEIRITHVPVYLDRSTGTYGRIFGHVSRNNAQSKLFNGKQPAVIVFRGPHAYISPTWAVKMGSVPTWNFAVVHASGKLRAVDDKQSLRALLAKLIDKFEDYRTSAYSFAKVPDEQIQRMMGGIIGFEMEIELLEGKFKLGQERGEADRKALLEHMAKAKPERSPLDVTAEFFGRVKASGA